jgi:hypothetical protein
MRRQCDRFRCGQSLEREAELPAQLYRRRAEPAAKHRERAGRDEGAALPVGTAALRRYQRGLGDNRICLPERPAGCVRLDDCGDVQRDANAAWQPDTGTDAQVITLRSRNGDGGLDDSMSLASRLPRGQCTRNETGVLAQIGAVGQLELRADSEGDRWRMIGEWYERRCQASPVGACRSEWHDLRQVLPHGRPGDLELRQAHRLAARHQQVGRAERAVHRLVDSGRSGDQLLEGFSPQLRARTRTGDRKHKARAGEQTERECS